MIMQEKINKIANQDCLEYLKNVNNESESIGAIFFEKSY